ncbi:MAG: imidazole glycerol phosphate synthase subunit HisH [Bacteroidia bacterium]|nr:imidazole glycerol phosphate synthase subunit HisH [Bacteroidia bacterium]
MKTVIIKYNAGNVQSVQFALKRLGAEAVLSDDPDVIRGADKVIFPGVGEASGAMQYLRTRGLDKVIVSLRQPVLGICLGMQLMGTFSEEGHTACLGIIPARVIKFSGDLKVPQVGWNRAQKVPGKSPLFSGVPDMAYYYFVHGYYMELCGHTDATTMYGINYSSAVHSTNFFAVQFHPERSGRAGELILKNFLAL